MSQLRRVVTEEVQAGDLSDWARSEIEPDHRVTVIVYEEPKAPVTHFEARPGRFWGVGAPYGTTTEEAVAGIRAHRDEWD